MSRRYARILVAGCAAVLAATLGTGTALAAATWTVQPGGSVLLKSGRVTLTDTKTDNSTFCRSALVSGTLQGGSGLSGTGAGSITAVSFRCEGTSVPNLVMRAADLPWQVNFISYNAATGTVTGSLSHVQIKLKSVPGGPLRCVGRRHEQHCQRRHGEVHLRRVHRHSQGAHCWRQPALLPRQKIMCQPD